MDSKHLTSISSQIYRQFPEVDGVRPKVSAQTGAQPKSGPGKSTVVLTYKGSARTADGKTIARTVRVVASEDGKIIKVTTTR